MFCSAANLVTKFTVSRMGLIAAATGLAGMTAPMMGAGPWFWHYPVRRAVVVVRPDPVVFVSASGRVRCGDSSCPWK